MGCCIYTDNVPPSLEAIAGRYLAKKNSPFPEELRNFALSVNFYSTKAYEFLRQKWKVLPAASTLRRWYHISGGNPGFTREAFTALERLQKSSTSKVICNLVLDEMSVKKFVYFNPNTLDSLGYVDIGVIGGSGDDDIREAATSVLVVMAVALNGGWKVPIAYFPIKSLTASQKASVITIALQMLHESGVHVYSFTFDGVSSNLSMCNHLGANLDLHAPDFQPWITHPMTGKPVFVFPDPCHMVKNVRNAFGEKGPFLDAEGRKVDWQHILELHKVQEKDGLTAANKLTTRHINFKENKMNVRLAAQVFSSSVSTALRFLSESSMMNEYGPHDVLGTADFCSVMNDAFDILNCRSLASKAQYCRPLCNNHMDLLQSRAKVIISYLLALRHENGPLVVDGPRKTGFVGLIICLKNVFSLYETLTQESEMTYLLTYKLLQDAIENFFSAIRSRGGYCSNPTVVQFKAAYSRLLNHFEVVNCQSGTNCISDGAKFLKCIATSSRQKVNELSEDDHLEHFLEDHDYLQSSWHLSEYVGAIVEYIAGFIAFRLKSTLPCLTCRRFVEGSTKKESLISYKSRGNLTNPSTDVTKICLAVEKKFRQRSGTISSTKFKHVIIRSVRSELGGSVFDDDEMDVHSADARVLSHGEDPIVDHRQDLLDRIIHFYLKIRLHHEARLINQPKEYVRRKYHRLVIFKNQ